MKKTSVRNSGSGGNVRKSLRGREDKQHSNEFCHKRGHRNGRAWVAKVGLTEVPLKYLIMITYMWCL